MKSELVKQLKFLDDLQRDSVTRAAATFHEHVVVDSVGKTIQTTKSKRTKTKSEPSFVKTYLADLPRIFKGNPAVFFAMAKRMEYRTNLVSLTDRVKREIAEEVGFTNPLSLKNVLRKFVDQRLVHKISATDYMLDPYVVAKGRWADIQQARVIFQKAAVEFYGDPSRLRVAIDEYVERGEDRKRDLEISQEFGAECLAKQSQYLADFDPIEV